MEFCTNQSIEISTLALDGLSARHKLLAANVANADTPGYKRVDIKFEDQLKGILGKEEHKENQRQFAGSMSYEMKSLNDLKSLSGAGTVESENSNYKSFKPEMFTDSGVTEKADGNGVNIEFEMAELSKNGMKYAAVSQMQANEFKLILDTIKGGGM